MQRSGTMWRSAVLASLALLMSGQLCMLTTCVPRLQAAHQPAHACCHAAPGSESPAPSAPTGAMPCDQSVNLAAAPTLDAPAPLAIPVALVAEISLAPAALERVAFAAPERDIGPTAAVHAPAPTGLRAPPRA
jgi:hypothetical protein